MADSPLGYDLNSVQSTRTQGMQSQVPHVSERCTSMSSFHSIVSLAHLHGFNRFISFTDRVNGYPFGCVGQQ